MRFVRNLLSTGLAAAVMTVAMQAQPMTDGQGDVGIGTIAPEPSAILELQSTTKGFLTPRMTTAQRDLIAAPVDGLLIYNIDTHIFEYWASVPGAWLVVGAVSGPYWLLTGNSALTEYAGGGPGVDNYIGTNDATDFSLVTQTANNIDFWTNNTHVAILTATGDLGVGELAPSARLDVVGDNVNTAIEATNSNTFAIYAARDGGTGLALSVNPAIYGDNNNGAGVAGVGNGGAFGGPGVYGTVSIAGTGVWGVGKSAGEYGVHGRNDDAGGYAIFGQSAGTGAAGLFNTSGGVMNTVEINDRSTGDALEINAFAGSVGIDLNGGELDGDDQGNALGDGSANAQLTVRGTADAVIGNTIAGNPTAWDLTVVGDIAASGIIKSGGSIWIDGVTPGNHQMVADDQLNVGTLGTDDLTVSTNGTNAIIVDGTTQDVNILNDLDVDGNTNVDGTITGNSAGNVLGDNTNATQLTIDGDGGGALPYELVVDGDAQIAGLLGMPSLTPGSVTFVNAANNIGEDNANFFWNEGANQLGIGTNVTSARLDIVEGGVVSGLELNKSGAGFGALFTSSAIAPTILTTNTSGAQALVATNNGGNPTITGSNIGAGNAGVFEKSVGGLPVVHVTKSGAGDAIGIQVDNNSNEDGVEVNQTGNGTGIDVNANNHGIVSNSANGYGVFGLTNNFAAAAVLGENLAGGNGVQGITSGAGIAVYGNNSGAGTGVLGISGSGNAGLFETNGGAANTVEINSLSTGDALEINANFGGIGIDLNGGELDGDDQGNALGDGSANQQLTVRGSANAVVGNTLGGNPTVWDLVVQGDVVSTGLMKVGGSMWLDGTSATHELNTNAPLLINTTAGNIEIDAAGGTTTIDDNLIVTGTSDLQNSIFNSTGSNGGAVQIADPLEVNGTSNLHGSISNSTGNIVINDDVDITGDIVPTANATYDLGSNTNRWADIYVDGASVHIGDAVGTEMLLGYAGNIGSINVDGGVEEIEIDKNNNTIRFDADGNGTFEVRVFSLGLGITTGGGLGGDLVMNRNGIRRLGAGPQTFEFETDLGGALNLSLPNGGNIAATGNGNTFGDGGTATQLTVNGTVDATPDVQINGDLDVTGSLTFSGGFVLGADLDMNGNDIVDNFDGVVTVNDDFAVTGTATINQLTVTNQTTSGTLQVGGNSSFSGNAVFGGTGTFNGTTMFNASSTWAGGNNVTLTNGTITANKTAAGSAVAINNTNGTNAIALNVAAGGGRTILSYGTGAGVIPTDVSVWEATGNVTLPGSVENGQILHVVNTSGGAITVTGVTGGTAAGFNNNDVRSYVYAGGWFELP